jgi:CBS domain-containing protein
MMRTNIRVAQQVFRAASPAAFAGMQQQFAHDYLHALLEGSAGIMRGLQQTAQQALRPLEQRISHLNEIRARQEECRRVADVMARQVRVVSPDDTVQQVARTMREADTGVLPVGDGEKLVGMVTDRDVTVRLVAEGKDPSRTRVRDVMSPDVRYVFEDEDLEHVAQNMAQQQVHRLPVMNRQKRLVGVVSLGDIAKGRQPAMAGQALSGIARPSGQHTQAAAE